MILSRHLCPSRDTLTTLANIGLSRCHDVTLESPGYRGGEKISQRPTPICDAECRLVPFFVPARRFKTLGKMQVVPLCRLHGGYSHPTPWAALLRREGTLELEIWSLEFLWSLKLGIWSFFQPLFSLFPSVAMPWALDFRPV